MNWQSLNFDWNRAKAFLVTAEEGSLSAAARALGVSQPTLGRQVSALEEELNVVLFARVGRGLSLTPAGADLLEHIREMGTAATRASLVAGGQSQDIEGKICITASEIYSAFLLPPILKKLSRIAPGICVEIIATNNVMDLQKREADIAIRNVRPTQPDLVARKLRDDTAQLYATPDYLKSIGSPSMAKDLKEAGFIGFSEVSVMVDGLNALGVSVSADSFKLTSNSHLVQLELAKMGFGIAILPTHLARNISELEQVLVELPPITYPVWLTTHQEIQKSKRIRLVFDLLAEELNKALSPHSKYSP